MPSDGQFKTKSLQTVLKRDSEFLEMVKEACVVRKEKIGHPNDKIEELICGDFSESIIIDHLVAKRGDYFHGRKGVNRHGLASVEEGKSLSAFVGEITDLICKREIGKVLDEESWKYYEEAAEASGNVVQLRYEATIIDYNCSNRVKSCHVCKMPGALHNVWNRLEWAYDALVSLKASDDTHEVETIVGRHVDSGSMVFSVELATSETISFEGWELGRRDGSEFVSMADINFFYDGGDRKIEQELRIQPSSDIGPADNTLVRQVAAMAIFGNRERPFDGLYMVQGIERRSGTQLFRILLDEKSRD